IRHTRLSPDWSSDVCSSDLAGNVKLSMADIADWPVALMGAGSTIRFIVDLCCMHEKIALNVVLTSNNQGAIQNFCRDCGAISFSTELTVLGSTMRGELVVIPMSNEELHQRNLHILTLPGRQLPGSATRFIQAVIERIEAS